MRQNVSQKLNNMDDMFDEPSFIQRRVNMQRQKDKDELDKRQNPIASPRRINTKEMFQRKIVQDYPDYRDDTANMANLQAKYQEMAIATNDLKAPLNKNVMVEDQKLM